MGEYKGTRFYFGHLAFYYEPNGFIIPISAIFDKTGISICFGFWGLIWLWKKDKE